MRRHPAFTQVREAPCERTRTAGDPGPAAAGGKWPLPGWQMSARGGPRLYCLSETSKDQKRSDYIPGSLAELPRSAPQGQPAALASLSAGGAVEGRAGAAVRVGRGGQV